MLLTNVTPLLKNINTEPANEFIPLIAYPNSSEMYLQCEGWIKNGNSASFENFIPEWLELGIRYLGGCCRMYAEDIKSIRKEVNNFKRKRES